MGETPLFFLSVLSYQHSGIIAGTQSFSQLVFLRHRNFWSTISPNNAEEESANA